MRRAKKVAKTLTIQDVKDLGEALLEVGNRYPRRFVTEEDFYPLVQAYLHGRVPALDEEFDVESGIIDFKIGGTTNPAYLEVAVAPRRLIDADAEEAKPQKKTQLYGSQNKRELQKLSTLDQSKAKGRFLLLLDTWGADHDLDDLKETYATQESNLPGSNIVNVIYVARGKPAIAFKVKKRKRTKKTS